MRAQTLQRRGRVRGSSAHTCAPNLRAASTDHSLARLARAFLAIIHDRNARAARNVSQALPWDTERRLLLSLWANPSDCALRLFLTESGILPCPAQSKHAMQSRGAAMRYDCWLQGSDDVPEAIIVRKCVCCERSTKDKRSSQLLVSHHE